MKYNYIDTKTAIELHDNIIKLSGGRLGIDNSGLIESVLIHVQNDAYYPSFESKLSHLLYGLSMNHGFVDGNKRTSILVSSLFMMLNGYDNIVESFMINMEIFVLLVVKKIIDKDLLKVVITEILSLDDFTEETLIEVQSRIEKFIDLN
jgi:death-on-curing protein